MIELNYHKKDMEVNGKQILKKGRKTPKGILITYVICIIAIIASVFIMVYREENKKGEPIDLSINGALEVEENQYAYLNVEGLTDVIVVYGDLEDKTNSNNDQYCIAISGGYFYIVDLSNELLSQLKNIQDYTYGETETDVVPEPVKIYGVTEKFPYELKQYILNYYNEGLAEENKIPEEEFEEYFGNVLLNARRKPVDTTVEEAIIIIAIFCVFIAVILHITTTIISRRTKKYLKKNNYEDDIAQQLEDFVEEKHYKDKVVLTKDFLVDMQNGLVAFKYSDVKWIHIHSVKYYGTITVTSSIVVHLRDGKTNIQCVEIKGDATEEFMEIFNKICEKVPSDTLKGYTKENGKLYKEYKKEQKINR